MVSFRVRASSLSEVASLLGTVVATFDANLAAVDAHVNRTVDVSWRGEDAEVFAQGWSTFLATSAAVRQSLVALQSGLIAADGSYTQTEAGIQRGFAGRVGVVRNVGAASSSVGSRVDTGEQRADAISEFFGRDGDERSGAAFVGGGGVRASSGQRTGAAPADDDRTVEVEFEDGVTFAEVEQDVAEAGVSAESMDARVDAGVVRSDALTGGLDDLAGSLGRTD